MSKNLTPQTGPMVYCADAVQYGADPITYTNVWGNKTHCSYCGKTDHPKANAGTAVSMGENPTEESWAEFYAYAN